MKYKIWNKTDRLFTPSGDSFSAEEVLAKYKLAQSFDHIIVDAPINMGVFMEFTQTKEVYQPRIIDMASTLETTELEKEEMIAEYKALSTQEVLDLISYMEENPPVQEATAEERIASALEFQNLLALPDVEV